VLFDTTGLEIELWRTFLVYLTASAKPAAEMLQPSEPRNFAAVGQLGDGKSFGSILARTAASAAIGGTANELSGGSFANGAATGAFQHLFNDTVHAYWDRVIDNASFGIEHTTEAANSAVDYWVDYGGPVGAFMGTAAMSMTSEYIACTSTGLFFGGMGAGYVGLGRGAQSLRILETRVYRRISRAYWAKPYGPANGRSLHHWLLPQRSSLPRWLVNSRFNLMELPPIISTPFGGLNQWMGLSRSPWVPVIDWSVRISVPTSIGGGAFPGGAFGCGGG